MQLRLASTAVVATNEFGQPISNDLGSWTPPGMPEHQTLTGRWVRLEPFQRARHAIALFHTFQYADASLWTYMPFGPFRDGAELGQLLDAFDRNRDSLPFVVIVDGEAHGFISYLRIQHDIGVLEIGGIAFSPMIQRSTATTEAVFLLMRHAFFSGYRRVEWKCDALNEPSRNAAQRLGFMYEGTFRKATHYKGRNRDTAWFAVTDDDWVVTERVLSKWLSLDNFDADGKQRVRLGDMA